ncbi:helix-turn-helix transcriptional regulator [Methylobacterium sp. 092160098-2]|uniref:helix-turn-helix domain-containing protein n=1 Tax=Methylobacterium sp. 092160098-2 TaxID=3025129 RepID=UPI002381A0E9|nr:helix-turn-helix transcriptional regulator [Methylobacterium sp. 092160098-2]MDE4910356.1 helix-turn-helix transcriptional regulator [Methylobacterium sp. 092160098-2]
MAGQPATDVDVRIGERICAARIRARLTQRTVATAIGVSAAQLQKYEKGTNRISGVALSIIAQLTGAPIASFFDVPETPAPLTAPQTVDRAREHLLRAADLYVEARLVAGEVASRRALNLVPEAA